MSVLVVAMCNQEPSRHSAVGMRQVRIILHSISAAAKRRSSALLCSALFTEGVAGGVRGLLSLTRKERQCEAVASLMLGGKTTLK
mmetsp:Transcript_16536/g.25065  ORF Transcript_16536/g.25065 Transcript_16536/m.25065 type:complete len:85 (+) Transcript_16536:424-678(+)